MKNSKLLYLSSLIILTSLPLASQAFTFDIRGGYRSGSHAYETRLKVANGWQNGWWASLETDSWNSMHGENDRLLKLSYNEQETNYTINLNDSWALRPGMLTHWDKNGTRFGPYLKLSWDASKNLNLAIRYRYDYNVYSSVDSEGNNAHNNQHRYDGYLTYRINDLWTASWQTTLYTRQNNFRYGNHKSWATENAFVLQYKLTPSITPYIEYDYLDRQGVYQGIDNITENSYRIGVTFAF